MKTIITASSLIVSVALLAPGAFAKAKEMTGSDRAELGQNEKGQADSRKAAAATQKVDAMARRDAATSKEHDKRDAKRAERDAKRSGSGQSADAEQTARGQGKDRAHERFGKHGAHPGRSKGLEKQFERLDTDDSGSLSLEEFTARRGRGVR